MQAAALALSPSLPLSLSLPLPFTLSLSIYLSISLHLSLPPSPPGWRGPKAPKAGFFRAVTRKAATRKKAAARKEQRSHPKPRVAEAAQETETGPTTAEADEKECSSRACRPLYPYVTARDAAVAALRWDGKTDLSQHLSSAFRCSVGR